MSINFSELKSNINNWNNDTEDSLIRKLKLFADSYTAQTNDLAKNISCLRKELSKIEINYHNSMNTLKNISIKKFVEHSVNQDAIENKQKSTVYNQDTNPYLSKEEQDNNLRSKFQNAISNTIQNLNIKDLIDKEIDDTVSVSSSKYFGASISKSNNKGVKLPYIIGQENFFKHPYLGLANDNFTFEKGNPNQISNKLSQDSNTLPSPQVNAKITEQPVQKDVIKNEFDDLVSLKSRSSITNIKGRSSIVVSSKTPGIIIVNNDIKGANIPKVPILTIPIPKKKENKPIVQVKEVKDTPTTSNIAPKDDFRAQLMSRFASRNNVDNEEPTENAQTEKKSEQVINKSIQIKENKEVKDDSKQEQIKPPIIMPPSSLLMPNKFKTNLKEEDEEDGKLFGNSMKTKSAFEQDNLKKQRASALFAVNDEDALKEQHHKTTLNFNKTVSFDSEVDTTKTSSDPLTQTNFLNRKDTIKVPAKPIEEKPTQLNKARKQILKMFEDEEDNDEEEIIKTKSNSVYKKLSILLDNKKQDPLDIVKNENSSSFYKRNKNTLFEEIKEENEESRIEDKVTVKEQFTEKVNTEVEVESNAEAKRKPKFTEVDGNILTVERASKLLTYNEFNPIANEGIRNTQNSIFEQRPSENKRISFVNDIKDESLQVEIQDKKEIIKKKKPKKKEFDTLEVIENIEEKRSQVTKDNNINQIVEQPRVSTRNSEHENALKEVLNQRKRKFNFDD